MHSDFSREGAVADGSAGVKSQAIYHLAPESEIRSGLGSDAYLPARFAADGFVHCAAGPESVLAVAADYFAAVTEPVMLLEIDPDRLTVPWRFEQAAPIEGGGTDHLETADRFPHVYGAVNRGAIRGIATLGTGDGTFRWPDAFAEIGPPGDS